MRKMRRRRRRRGAGQSCEEEEEDLQVLKEKSWTEADGEKRETVKCETL